MSRQQRSHQVWLGLGSFVGPVLVENLRQLFRSTTTVSLVDSFCTRFQSRVRAYALMTREKSRARRNHKRTRSLSNFSKWHKSVGSNLLTVPSAINGDTWAKNNALSGFFLFQSTGAGGGPTSSASFASFVIVSPVDVMAATSGRPSADDDDERSRDDLAR